MCVGRMAAFIVCYSSFELRLVTKDMVLICGVNRPTTWRSPAPRPQVRSPRCVSRVPHLWASTAHPSSTPPLYRVQIQTFQVVIITDNLRDHNFHLYVGDVRV